MHPTPTHSPFYRQWIQAWNDGYNDDLLAYRTITGHLDAIAQIFKNAEDLSLADRVIVLQQLISLFKKTRSCSFAYNRLAISELLGHISKGESVVGIAHCIGCIGASIKFKQFQCKCAITLTPKLLSSKWIKNCCLKTSTWLFLPDI